MNQIVFDGASLITPEAIATEYGLSSAELYREEFETGKAHLALILKIAEQNFRSDRDAGRTVRKLSEELHHLRRKVHLNVWQRLVPIAQGHPVADFLHQDPFTRWSFRKPRGYSGDAQLIDFIYAHASVSDEVAGASPIGQAVYDSGKAALSSVAVRERRDLLARHVDELAAAQGRGTEILTIAAGHLREASHSIALRQGRIKRWVALDQDPVSVASIARDFRGTAVEAIEGSVRGLLTRAHKLGRFDFVYAAGLYDYLPYNVAVKLTQKCFEILKPNGVLLFANFSPDISDDGYMETFMNWALLLRSERDMWDIVNASVDRNAVEAEVFFGANRNIVYATIEKRAESTRVPAGAVSGASKRFDILMDPTDRWIVWDNVRDLPAERGQLELFGLSHADAVIHCRQLNGAGSFARPLMS